MPLEESNAFLKLENEIDQVSRDVSDLLAGLSDGQFAWQPDPKTWSIGQCIQHLTATTNTILPKINDALDEILPGANIGNQSWSPDWKSQMYIRETGFPVKRRYKSSSEYHPGEVESLKVAGVEFLNGQSSIVEAIRRARGINMADVKFTVPGLRILKFDMGTWFSVLAGHGRRHLEQARRVIVHPDFPSAHF